jgi:hypothetical protein
MATLPRFKPRTLTADEEREVATFLRAIDENVANLYDGIVDDATFAAMQREIWTAAEEHNISEGLALAIGRRPRVAR